MQGRFGRAAERTPDLNPSKIFNTICSRSCDTSPHAGATARSSDVRLGKACGHTPAAGLGTPIFLNRIH